MILNHYWWHIFYHDWSKIVDFLPTVNFLGSLILSCYHTMLKSWLFHWQMYQIKGIINENNYSFWFLWYHYINSKILGGSYFSYMKMQYFWSSFAQLCFINKWWSKLHIYTASILSLKIASLSTIKIQTQYLLFLHSGPVEAPKYWVCR